MAFFPVCDVLSVLQKKLVDKPSLFLRVKVIPRSSKSELVGFLADGTLKIKLRAVPEDGRANEELRRLLAQLLSLSLDRISILSGKTSTLKYLRIMTN